MLKFRFLLTPIAIIRMYNIEKRFAYRELYVFGIRIAYWTLSEN